MLFTEDLIGVNEMVKYNLLYLVFATLILCSCSTSLKIKKVFEQSNTIVGMDGQSRMKFSDTSSVIYYDNSAPGDELMYYGTYKIKKGKIYMTFYDTLSPVLMSSPYCSLLKKHTRRDSVVIKCDLYLKDSLDYKRDFNFVVYIKNNGGYEQIKKNRNNCFEFCKKNEQIDLLFKSYLGLYYELSLLPLWDYDIKIYYDFDWILFKKNKVFKKTLTYRRNKFYEGKYHYSVK